MHFVKVVSPIQGYPYRTIAGGFGTLLWLNTLCQYWGGKSGALCLSIVVRSGINHMLI